MATSCTVWCQNIDGTCSGGVLSLKELLKMLWITSNENNYENYEKV